LQVIATISFEQFKAAVTATRKRYSQQDKKASWKGIGSIVLASFAITAALHTSGESFTALSAYLKGFALAFFILAALLFLLCKWQAARCLRKSYEVQKKQLNGQIMNIDESGINGQWENGDVTYHYRWSALKHSLIFPTGFSSFRTQSPSFVFPKIPSLLTSSEQSMPGRRRTSSELLSLHTIRNFHH
jgi:hypothetical protein